jgi:scyllo-inositol 2-dehydrogenase (NADP+)
MSNTKTVQVGLVGFGLAGRYFHAPLVQAAGMQLCGVVTSRPGVVAEVLPGVRTVPDFDALLALPELQVVVLATPNDLHEPQATAALRAGKCVVIDKPLAIDVASAERLMQVARQGRGSLTVFHNRRWDSDFLTVQKVLASGALGTLHTFEGRWNRYRPQVVERWREHAEQGGGLLLDLGPHLIDQALVLFGMPDWLQADILCRRVGSQIDDSFDLRLGYGPLRVLLSADVVSMDPGPRFRLQGTRGSYVKYGMDAQEAQSRAGSTPLAADFGVDPPEQDGVLISGEAMQSTTLPTERGRWIDYYAAVRAHVERGTPLPVDPAQARDGLRLLELARHSAATGARIALQMEP